MWLVELHQPFHLKALHIMDYEMVHCSLDMKWLG
jgi:hypothetical protein